MSKNKNETKRNFLNEEMVEFSNERMSVPGNRLVIGGKESNIAYSSQNEHDRNIRSLSGSLGETEESEENTRH